MLVFELIDTCVIAVAMAILVRGADVALWRRPLPA